MRTKLYKSSFLSLHYAIAVGKNSCFVLHCNVAYRYAIFLCSLLYLARPKKSSWATNYCNQARARSARARRACALRALGLLLADGTPTVGGGKTF